MNEFRILIGYVNGAWAGASLALQEAERRNWSVARQHAVSAAVNIIEACRIVTEMNDKLLREDTDNEQADNQRGE